MAATINSSQIKSVAKLLKQEMQQVNAEAKEKFLNSSGVEELYNEFKNKDKVVKAILEAYEFMKTNSLIKEVFIIKNPESEDSSFSRWGNVSLEKNLTEEDIWEKIKDFFESRLEFTLPYLNPSEEDIITQLTYRSIKGTNLLQIEQEVKQFYATGECKFSVKIIT